MDKQLSAHQFPKVFADLGINLSKLGCIMLDLSPIPVGNLLGQDGVTSLLYSIDEYKAKDPDRFWIDGYVGGNPHITLMYGLLTPGNESPMKELVPQVLEGWKYPPITISHVGYFPSPYPDEPYYCIVAHIDPSPDLSEGNARIKMLPHIDTFAGYKPHATIAYIKAERGEEYRDSLIAELTKGLAGVQLEVTGLNFGGNK